MKMLIGSIAALALACSAYAGGEGCTQAAAAKDGAKAASCGEKKDGCAKACSGKDAMPTMSYKVGDKSACCPNEAKTLAKGDEKAIKYVVAGKEYTDKAEAMKAYGTQLTDYVGTMTTVRFVVGDECVACPMAAGEMAKKSNKQVQFRVASATFDKKEDAEAAAKKAKEAADKVTMKMVADGKEVSCDQAKDAKGVEYVIGDMKTCCESTAKVELAKAKIKAISNAVAPKTAGV